MNNPTMAHWNELAVFAHVVRAGGFSAAADELGLAKATVSEHVRRLEQKLGVRLLQRNTRSLSLTEAGAACFRHSERLIDEGEAATRAAVALHTKPAGLLRVTAPATFGAMHVAPAIAALLVEHPDLGVELSLATAAVDLVKSKYDLAIRIGPLAPSRLVARRIASVEQVVVAAPSYLAQRRAPKRPEDLAEHDALQFTPLGWGDDWRLAGPGAREERRFPVRTRFASDSGEALVAAACAGVGLGLLPNWMIYREVRAGELVRVLPGWARSNVPVHAVHASAARAPAKVKICVDALLRHVGRRPYWEL